MRRGLAAAVPMENPYCSCKASAEVLLRGAEFCPAKTPAARRLDCAAAAGAHAWALLVVCLGLCTGFPPRFHETATHWRLSPSSSRRAVYCILMAATLTLAAFTVVVQPAGGRRTTAAAGRSSSSSAGWPTTRS